VSNGISIELRMEPVAPHAGENVHFSITASSPLQPCCVTAFDLGDESFVPPPRYDVPCPAANPSVFTEQIDHAYAHAGAYTVLVGPTANNFCAGPMTAFVNAQLYATIVIAP
jgi:hypothetical protein